jgi:predicted dehydrogenase
MAETPGFTTMAGPKAEGEAPVVGVGMLGYAFMGKAHSNAFKTIPYMMYPPPAIPRMVAIAGRNEAAVAEAARRYGYERYYTDWRAMVDDPEVQLFDNGGPNDAHAEPSIYAAQAGKHILCEKPLGRTAEESKIMWDAVEKAGVKHMVAFNYRFVPAVRQIRYLIESGALGRIYHFRAVYLQEWIMPHYNMPMIWRLQKDVAGSGSPGRPGRTHHRPGPLPGGRCQQRGRADQDLHPGTALGRRDDGQGGRGRRLRRRNRIRERRRGHAGSDALRRRPQEFQLLRDQRRKGQHPLQPGAHERTGGLLGGRTAQGDAGLPQRAGERRLPSLVEQLVAQGHMIGWEHTFIHEITHLLDCIVNDRPVGPHGATFEDGYRAAVVCDAVVESAAARRTVDVKY